MAEQASKVKVRTLPERRVRPDAERSDLQRPMEHRLGTRMQLSVALWLRHASELPLPGRMLNVSLSGAYVETSAQYPLLASVSVACASEITDGNAASCLTAYVTRVSTDGMALEWFEFAPEAIRQLMRHDKPGTRGRIAATSVRRTKLAVTMKRAAEESMSLTAR